MEIRKIHTGIPAIIVDTLAGIVVNNINDFEFRSAADKDLWEAMTSGKENRFKKLLDRTVKEVLYIGDGAWKISIDTGISKYPIMEFFPGDRVEYTTKRGRVTEVIFKSLIDGHGKEKLELREIYGMNYIHYELSKDGKPVEMKGVEGLEGLQNTVFGSEDDPYMLAVPVQFFQSGRWEGRGQSVFDRKIENFDSLDEAWSQWMDALRAGRSKSYIPENLIPRDPHTGELKKPNTFDNRFIMTEADMSQGAQNKIQTEQPAIPHDSYQATYITALDQCLQGLISPSTLGIDVKKLDNAEAQREKEKVTLYTRNNIIEPLQEDLKALVEISIRAYNELNKVKRTEEISVDVTFGDYANPSFESQVETVGKAKAQGIMSLETAVDELYGDNRDDSWKEEEVRRLKEEQGVVNLEEPAIGEGAGIFGLEMEEGTEGGVI